MKLLIMSDIDGEVSGKINSNPDLIISCGDVPDEIILETADNCKCEAVLAVKGDKDRPEPFTDPIIDLHLNTYLYGKYRFGGFQGAVKYNPADRNFLYEDFEVYPELCNFPVVDIFVAHNSPFGIHDRDYCENNGFSSFNTYIENIKPQYMFHGHQCVNSQTPFKQTKVFGVFGYKEIELK